MKKADLYHVRMEEAPIRLAGKEAVPATSPELRNYGIAIRNSNGDLVVWYPVKEHPATHIGASDTIELSEEFLWNLQVMSSQGKFFSFDR